MRKIIMKGVALVNGGSTSPVPVPRVNFDTVCIRLSQNNTANKLLIANLDKLVPKLILKSGNDQVRIIDARFIDLMHRTNYRMGYPGSDTEFEYQVVLPVGTINQSDFIEGSILFTLGTIASLDSAPKVDVEFFHANVNLDMPVRAYESFPINGQQILQNIFELYQIDVPADRTIKVVDPYTGDIDVNDTLSLAWSKALGQYEANTAVSLIYADNTGQGTTIQITTPANLNMLVVSRK